MMLASSGKVSLNTTTHYGIGEAKQQRLTYRNQFITTNLKQGEKCNFPVLIQKR